jgi:hypothetical protein
MVAACTALTIKNVNQANLLFGEDDDNNNYMEIIRTMKSPTTGERLIIDIAATNEDRTVKPIVPRVLAREAQAALEKFLSQQYKNPEGEDPPTLQRKQFEARKRPPKIPKPQPTDIIGVELQFLQNQPQKKSYSQAAQQAPPTTATKTSTAPADDTTTTAATEMTTDNTSITSDKSPTTQLEDEVAQLKCNNNTLAQQLTRAKAVIALHKVDYNKLETKFHELEAQMESLRSQLQSVTTTAQQQQYDDDSPGTVTHDEDPPRA